MKRSRMFHEKKVGKRMSFQSLHTTFSMNDQTNKMSEEYTIQIVVKDGMELTTKEGDVYLVSKEEYDEAIKDQKEIIAMEIKEFRSRSWYPIDINSKKVQKKIQKAAETHIKSEVKSMRTAQLKRKHHDISSSDESECDSDVCSD